MARSLRMVISEEKAIYHIISKTALDGLPFGDIEKDELVSIIQRFSALYFTDVLGYAIMGNHFHLLVVMHPTIKATDAEIRKRYHAFHGAGTPFPETRMAHFRAKWCNLSEYVKDIKQTFSRFYNKRKNRTGTLWGDRFKSVIVQNGGALINCLAYIDLNAVRAGIVQKPEEYRWCSLGYRIQTCNTGAFLSDDLGLMEFGIADPEERLKRYREFVYHTGTLEKTAKAKISQKSFKEEAADKFSITPTRQLMFRTRYLTDSGVIGSRAFIEETFQRFKDRVPSKRKRAPKEVPGITGVFALKRLCTP